MALKIFYAAGPGDVIGAHRNWEEGRDDPTQMSLTYSGQFADVCKNVDADAYIVSSNEKTQTVRSGRFIIEHRPKRDWGGGLRYHFSEIYYGLSLLVTAVRFCADVAVICSGTTHYFVLSLFRLFGIQVIVSLHNTLWPKGCPPQRLVPRTVLWLDGLFFRWLSNATLGISPECTRQVAELTKGRARSLYVMYPQFRREYFQDIQPSPPIDELPVRIVFAARIERNKGVFDILEMARELEARLPGRIHWDICGSGADLEALIQQHKGMGLESIVTIHGWTAPADLRRIQGVSHLSIVPTRSDFAEGMAKTALEAILAGRPVIASTVTPAIEIIRAASVEARTDDVDNFVEVILELILNKPRYLELVASCRSLQEQFYDRKHGFSAALNQALVESRMTA